MTKAEPAALDVAREYARIVRGEHPGWEGDATLNAESFALGVGREYPGDAPIIAASLRDSSREISLLTGLPPSSLERIARYVLRGSRKKEWTTTNHMLRAFSASKASSLRSLSVL